MQTTAEEELKELTLDEWKALKAPRQKPTYNIRKAGEGEDPTQWKKMYALQKKKDGEEEEEDDEFVSNYCSDFFYFGNKYVYQGHQSIFI